MNDLKNSDSPIYLIQTGTAPGGTVTPQTSTKDFIEGSEEQLASIADVLEIAGHTFTEKVKRISSKPKGCSLEFGINVGGEAGIPFITKGTIAANFKVTITWEFKE